MSQNSQKCPVCGSYEIDFDAARGQSSCMSCGEVLEQNAIVAEVGFAEDARGRSNMVGQHVRADGRSNFASMPGYSARATFNTMLNARHKLRQLVSALKLHQRHTEAAERLFRLAAERNFHRGRRLANVSCACLYAVCRIEKTPHMLLDFADVLETNVYLLGHTFLKLAQVVALNLPVIDPSLYIHRFASKLEFGDKTNAVAMTALRILARMQRDWLSHGRRPSSLCGAALVCAAGIHQFHRSMVDVCRVVRVGNVTLRERLQELNKTPTAGMTATQIISRGGDDGREASLMVEDEPLACDPPAFQRLQKVKQSKRKDPNSSSKSLDGALSPKRQRSSTDIPSTQVIFASAQSNDTTKENTIQEQMKEVLATAEMQQLDRESRQQEQLDAVVLIGTQETEPPPKQTIVVDKENEMEQMKSHREDLSDLEEEDVGRYFNTEEEYRRKEVLWTEINKEYIEKQERLEAMRKERPEEFKRLRPTRRTHKKKSAGGTKAQKSEETEKNVLAEPPPPKPSKKLNYAKLKQLALAANQEAPVV